MKIVKRLAETARVTYMLLRELCVYSLGYTEIFSDADGTAAFTPDASGADGQLSLAAPQTFVSGSAAFTSGDIGKYLTLGGTYNYGIYKITAVTSSSTVTVQGGLYGASFTTEISVPWRLMDPANVPAALAGKNLTFIVEGTGTGPAWQASFTLLDADTAAFHAVVAPFGGYDGTGTPTLPVTTTANIGCDSTPLWYILADTSYIRIWSEAAAGTSFYNLAYIGSASSKRPTVDTNFAICLGGTSSTALATVRSIGSDDATQISYEAVTYGDSVTPNMFTSLPASTFDMRNDTTPIIVGSNHATYPEDDRGSLKGLHWVSSSLIYRSFVDNGRHLLCLGNGIGIEWDGSLAH